MSAKTDLLFQADSYQRSCAARVLAVDERGIQLDRTVFYANSGGQPGDTGWLVLPDGARLKIIDTRKGEAPGEIIHVPEAGASLPALGTEVTANIDWERRYRHMRFHTSLHLLSKVLAVPATGNQIAEDKARADFTELPGALDKAAIEQQLNALIAQGQEVRVTWIDEAELDRRPELVRTLYALPPRGQGKLRLIDIVDTDQQPCGGTHVANTREIGPIQVLKIENKGKENKRVVLGFASSSA